MIPADHRSVMAGRREPPDSLDLFCTPPWCTRALIETVLQPRFLMRPEQSAWDPACGLGHMTAVLEEYFRTVMGTDIFPHGGVREEWPAGWNGERDFLDARAEAPVADWIITNPPFSVADDFALRALEVARVGVALLVRTGWIDGQARYRNVFAKHPPTLVAQFAERVPMHKGRWEPKGSTATAYAFVVWADRDHEAIRNPRTGCTDLVWIPPGQRERLTRGSDIRRLGVETTTPLLDIGASA